VSDATVKATEVQVGDRIRSGGLELVVSRIDLPFLGRDDMLAFVEDTELRWLKVPVPLDADVEILAT
jgi:hypothetical protein